MSRRQPGSVFKPFVFLSAFEYAAAEGKDDDIIVVVIPDFGERYIQTKLFDPYRYEGSDDVLER